MKTVIFLIIVTAAPGSCALVQINESTHSAIEMKSMEECEAQAEILSLSLKQTAFCVEGEPQ